MWQSIEGLSPAISIDQKLTNDNPRSTVGTVTEIYDYFRLLVRKGWDSTLSEASGKEIKKQSVDEMVDQILSMGRGDEDSAYGAGSARKKRDACKTVRACKEKRYMCGFVWTEIYMNYREEITLDKNIKNIISRLLWTV